MDEFTNWDIISSLLLAMRWTVLLSLIAFAGGTLITIVLLLLRLTCGKTVNLLVSAHVNLFQGTPLLMQLFLVFFTFPLLGVEVSPWTAAGVCLTLYASAYLIDIWYSAVQSLPKGQWEACRVLGLSFTQTLVHVIAMVLKSRSMQAALTTIKTIRIATPPTVGFCVQLIKGTALTSIIGFEEMAKAATMLTNATFQPFKIYGLVALGYFLLCYPLSVYARRLERTMQ